MIAPEKAIICEKWGDGVNADTPTIINKQNTVPSASNGAALLSIRSVIGSAFPMPPHDWHIKPVYGDPFNSFLLMHAAQDAPFSALRHVPSPLQ